MNARHNKILEVLGRQKRITVTELAALLNVSEVTTRKDLSLLEKKGLLVREHGFAALAESDDINRRLSLNYETKRLIARKALETVADGETVMIESGSTCALLAEALVTERRDITIVTNSVFIATFIRNQRGAHTILLGGEFQNEPQVMVGPMVRKCASSFYVDKLFVGTDGFNERGAMSGDLMRAEATQAMAENTKEVIILTESAKFSRIGVVALFSYQEIGAIYTDDSLDKAIVASLAKKGIKVHTIPASSIQ